VQRAAGRQEERLPERPPQRLGRTADLLDRSGDRRLVRGAECVVDAQRRQSVHVGVAFVEPDPVVRGELLAAEPAEADDLTGPNGGARIQRHRRSVHLHDLAVVWPVGGVGHPGDPGDGHDGAPTGCRGGGDRQIDADGCVLRDVPVVQDGGGHHLWVLGEVPAERGGTDAGDPQQSGCPEGVGRDDNGPGAQDLLLAAAGVDVLHSGCPVAVEHDPRGQRAGAQRHVRPLPQVAGDDGGAAPVQRPIRGHGRPDGHRADRAPAGPVEHRAEYPLDRAGQWGAVEGMGGDGEQLLRLSQRFVKDGGVEEVGHFVVRRPWTGRRPVRAHAAGVRRDGGVGHGRRSDQRRAGPGGGAPGHRVGAARKRRQHTVALLGGSDVPYMAACRLAEARTGLEHDQAQRGVGVGQLAGDRRADRTRSHDDDVVRFVHRPHAWSTASSTDWMSPCPPSRPWTRLESVS
jgi:hypothetical protein